MQPNQYPAPPPAPLPSAGPPNDYEFIFNPPGTPKKRFSLPGGNSPTQRILLVVSGAILLLFLIIMFFSAFSSGSKNSTQTMIDLAEEQAELVRVATTGVQKSRGADSKNLAITTQLSIQTAETQTVNLLKNRGHKLSSKQLALKQNAQTDETLNNADLNNNFDTTFTQLMKNSLSSYRNDLKKAYDASKSASEKQILSSSFTSTSVLIAGIPSSQSS